MEKIFWIAGVGTLLTIVLLFLFSFKYNTKPMLHYHQDNYEAEWKVVDSLTAQGLPQSALEKVNTLYNRAKSENNLPQLVKTIIYKATLTTQLEEEGQIASIQLLQNEEKSASFPVKSILQSLLAEQINSYLESNYWKLKDRSNLTGTASEDIRTWSVEQYLNASTKLYLQAIDNEQLKQISTKEFQAILTEPQQTAGLRPTLFDVLAHRAIDFFSNERSYLTQPANKFYINQEEALADANTFAKATFSTPDTNSYKFRNLLLMQELMATHLKDDTPEALIDLDLKRLKFVFDNAVLDNKSELYLQQLENLENRYTKHPMASEIIYHKADYYYQTGSNYNSTPDNPKKWNWKTAYELCQKAIKQYPNTYGAQQCKKLLTKIESKSLQIQAEQVVLPNQPFLIQVQHRNLPEAHFKLIQLDEDDWTRYYEMNYSQRIEKLNGKKALRQWSIKLPQAGDFRSHTVEISSTVLPLGYYILLASDDKDFSTKEKLTSFLLMGVSNIGYWHRQTQQGSEFIVMDRKSGVPLEGVTAEFYNQEYDQGERRNKLKKLNTAATNKDGIVKANLDDRYFQVKFKKGADVLFFGDGYSNYNYRYPTEKSYQTHFFLDRSIYRPGQTIYFKAIVLQQTTGKLPEIAANESVLITFFDANYQEVKKLQLTTNEYGTVNGSFVAPTGSLLGQMHLKSSSGENQHFFRVEEYKRPKFEVAFEPVKESYRLEDLVTVNGYAKAFAGNNIDGAKVSYRVVREVRYPWISWWWRRFYDTGESMEIKNGETVTDAEGKFQVQFPALPDLRKDKTQKPEFHYKVYADVVDITGETHSSETTVVVGYIALQVGVELPEKIALKDFTNITIQTKNLNGEFEAAKGKLTIHQLKAPNQIFINRYWEAPDQFLMSEKEFKKQFPLLPYQQENEIQNWAVGNQVYVNNFDTNIDKVLAIDNWQPGSYELRLETKDKYGQPVEIKRHFTVYDLESRQVPLQEIAWNFTDKSKYEPLETAILHLGTNDSEANVLVEWERERSIIRREWVTVKNLQKLEYAVQEADRGNIHLHLAYAKHNRSNTQVKQIEVPWSNKELKIEYSTFRDKLLPGQDEEWRIKISGPKGEKVAAEIVAAMYDASLDQFTGHNWMLSPYPIEGYTSQALVAKHFQDVQGQQIGGYYPNYSGETNRQYQNINWFEPQIAYYALESRAVGLQLKSFSKTRRGDHISSPAPAVAMEAQDSELTLQNDVVTSLKVSKNSSDTEEKPTSSNNFSDVPIRKNLEETAFFFPTLKTDADGNVIISFKMKESLTKWKFLGMAHTKDLKIGLTENEVITQKELMVQPNPPRFLREGDQIVFTAKVSNLTKAAMLGNAKLELLDATTMQPVHELFDLKQLEQNFTAAAGQSALLSWQLHVPAITKVPALVHRVVAQSGNYSDGEESALPILTNRMLVTETMPIPMRGKKQQEFVFASLASAGSSKTLEHHSYSLEFTSNPAWYAVQALPYLMEYPYDCIEQVFNRYYANSLATTVANAHPRIKAVFDTWREQGTGAMESNLAKNQDLKYVLLEETPWVLEAQSEAQQKRNIGLLFDLTKMAEEQNRDLNKIIERQAPDGGFSWFPGGRSNWYMTQYIVEGLGHLDKLGVKSLKDDARTVRMLDGAVQFIDAELVRDFNEMKRYTKDLKKDYLSAMAIHYLYARSFFLNYPLEGEVKEVVTYYLQQADQYWLNKSVCEEGMLALAMLRMNKFYPSATPQKIVKSLSERAIRKEELGMYWKYDRGYYWHQLPIETHALLIEVFSEVAKDEKAVEEMKIWLLKNKQTTHWKTTKATSAAVYSLLMDGEDWLLEDQLIEAEFKTAGNPEIHERKLRAARQNAEVGTGYFKAQWQAEEITADMATIKVRNPNKTIAWGAAYWQYFEQLDRIKTFEATPLQLKKQLFKEINTPTGPKLEALAEGAVLKPGDKLKVRIEIRVDRAMEYIHLKDARASGFEPINVLSQYKWQGGLGYYESTGDAATNFFMDYLPTGTYVFEYPLRVVQEGDFSNGITTIQCMYAPEFTSHSEGIRVEVKR